jgi:hypothetical protein
MSPFLITLSVKFPLAMWVATHDGQKQNANKIQDLLTQYTRDFM